MTKRTRRWSAHFWTRRRDAGQGKSPVQIDLPRNPYSLEVMGMPDVDAERTMIVSRECAVPETIVAALPGRRADELIDHAMFHTGARGEGAIITWATIDDLGLKLVLDRPVQPTEMPADFYHSIIPRD